MSNKNRDGKSVLLLAVFGLLMGASAVLLHYQELRFALVTVVILATIILFLRIRKHAPRAKYVLLAAIGFRLLYLPVLPSLSDDAYRYVWDGNTSAVGVSPFEQKPGDVHGPISSDDEILLHRMNSAEFYSVYPPASQFVFASASILSRILGGGWHLSYFLIKGFYIIFDIGTVLILLRLVHPGAVVLYAWNPVVLIETAAQPHTESLLVFALILIVWKLREENDSGLGVLFGIAIWTKLYPILLLPFLRKKVSGRILVELGVTSLLLWIPFYTPETFDNFQSSLRLYTSYFEFNAGLYYAVKQVGLLVASTDYSKIIGPVFQVLFMMVVPVLWIQAIRKSWSFEKATLVLLTCFFVLSTTVHPWYLLPALALAVVVLERFPVWSYWLLALFSVGTYLLYTGGPYFPWVIAGWTAFGIAWAAHALSSDFILSRRAISKVDRLSPHLPDSDVEIEVLDLGCAEGFLGEEISKRTDARVTLADVTDMNRTNRELVVYDGENLPFDDRKFDIVILYFVLHHAREPQRVLSEAVRVSRDRVLVVESIYDTGLERKLLHIIDRLANRIRSSGAMNAQEEFLSFATADEWVERASRYDPHVYYERFGKFPHKQLLMRISSVEKRS